MSSPSTDKRASFFARFLVLAKELYDYTAPKGDKVVRARIAAAFMSCSSKII